MFGTIQTLKPGIRRVPGLLAVGCLALTTTGCGYFKNIRDDVMDLGTFAVGAIPPVICEDDRPIGIGPIPPAFGLYLQASDFCHAGFLYKSTTDIEWDRRGAGITHDMRRKIGLGPFHHIYIQQEPIKANAYKIPYNELDGWRNHMDHLGEPWFGTGAKKLIFEPSRQTWAWPATDYEVCSYDALRWFALGWQDWEMISAEIAFPEPFILHSGFYLRAGCDPSQLFDLALSIFCLDLYQDAAYNWCGNLIY